MHHCPFGWETKADIYMTEIWTWRVLNGPLDKSLGVLNPSRFKV